MVITLRGSRVYDLDDRFDAALREQERILMREYEERLAREEAEFAQLLERC